jgi:hypothetical protein
MYANDWMSRRATPIRLEFFFNSSHNSGSQLLRFFMAIVRVEVRSHSQQNFVYRFSGLEFRDEQPTTDATYTFDRFPLLNLFKKLKHGQISIATGVFFNHCPSITALRGERRFATAGGSSQSYDRDVVQDDLVTFPRGLIHSNRTKHRVIVP